MTYAKNTRTDTHVYTFPKAGPLVLNTLYKPVIVAWFVLRQYTSPDDPGLTLSLWYDGHIDIDCGSCFSKTHLFVEP